MGLDQFMTKETYVGAYYDFNKVEAKVEITVDGKPLNIDVSQLESVVERVGYWRKNNAVHKFFVEKVQDGIDECQKSLVAISQLKELRDKCKKALEFKDKASEILPTTEGFFFGGTDYDEWYFQGLEETVEIIDNALEGVDEDDFNTSFYYQASW